MSRLPSHTTTVSASTAGASSRPEGVSPEGPTLSPEADHWRRRYDKLEAKYDALADESDLQRKDLEAARAEVVSLREALEAADKWMMHAHYCGRLEEGGRLVCTCGYAEIKAKIEQSKGVGHG